MKAVFKSRAYSLSFCHPTSIAVFWNEELLSNNSLIDFVESHYPKLKLENGVDAPWIVTSIFTDYNICYCR